MPPITQPERMALAKTRKAAIETANQLTDSELATVVRFALYSELKDYRPSSIDPPILWLPIPTLQSQMAAVLDDRQSRKA